MKTFKKMQMTKCLVAVSVIALSLIIVAPAKAVNWGKPDTVHTNVGAMVVWFGDDFGQVCSGTLIDVEGGNGQFFLTAGHCTDYLEYLMYTDQIEDDDIYVNFNEDALDESGLLPVIAVITHPDYNWGPYSNPYDVGLLILSEDPGIAPAELAEEGFLDELKKARKLRQGKEEADFTVVGYGGTLNWPPPSVTYENKRRFAESEYQALLKSWLIMSQNLATGDGGTCYGDSGGPTFWTDPDTGNETLVSITSWGDIPTIATGISYRVDTSDTLDFIAAVVDEWLAAPIE